MGQDCSASAAAAAAATGGMGVGVAMSMHVDKDMDTPYLYATPPAYIEGGVQQAVASPYIPVTSPSTASDQPCYSPVTPVQSPANCKLDSKICVRTGGNSPYKVSSL